MKRQGLPVFHVEPGSIAGELGLGQGDRIISIDQKAVRDVIDFQFLEAEEHLVIEIEKSSGERWLLEVEKDFDQSMGIDFGEEGFGRTVRCANQCIFCFVNQMPPGMRETLYVKDDDYRLSFWCGNFITLTNLGEEELVRIARQRLSPLYISVHTTNPELRERMLGNVKAGLIMEQLRFLAAAGIEMHTQVVLCPGVNDGKELERTTADLAGLWPSVHSLAVVPVGLTRFRQSCPPLRVFTREEARRVVRWVAVKQEELLSKLNNPFIFASDEFYLVSDEQIPPAIQYADFPQTENGVGLTRIFLDEWKQVQSSLPGSVSPRKATLATGILGEKILDPVVNRLNRVRGMDVSIKTIVNRFFGEQVTVAGLITGVDLIQQMNPANICDLLILPSVMLKKEEPVFLDNTSLKELAQRLQVSVAVVEGPRQLVEVLIGGPKEAARFCIYGK